MWWILSILILIYVVSAVCVFIQINLLETKKIKSMVCLIALTPIVNTMFLLSILKIYYQAFVMVEKVEYTNKIENINKNLEN
jgi:hypothetical protein